jgi:hypothetical protein
MDSRACGETLPASERERYKEEWAGFLAEVPGDLSKVVAAFGFIVAAGRMSGLFVRVGKRSCDLAVASSLLLFFFPMLILCATLIKLDSPGPILARQRRKGMNGKPFTLYSFRIRDARTPSGAKVQWFIRESFGSLPYLLNIMKGDMSFIGPPLSSNDDHKNPPGLAPSIGGIARMAWLIIWKKVD